MKKLIVIGVLFAAYWYWNDGQLPFLNGSSAVAVDGNGNPAVWVFTFSGCGDACNSVVKELRNRNVPFSEKVISPDQRDEPDYKLWQGFRAGNAFPLVAAGNQTATGSYVPAIASLLGKTFGEAYLTPAEKRYFKSHFNADGSPRIVLYGTDWCGYCAALRKEFRANQVSFQDVDVEKQGDKNQLLQTMGINGYPATWVGYTRVQNGSDYNAVMSLVKNSN